MTLALIATAFGYLDSIQPPLVIAHRAGAGLAPENTIKGWRYVKQLCQPDVFELDIHLSADDSLMVVHDASVDRTTDGNGKVRDLSYAELRGLDAGFWFTPDSGETYPWRGKGVLIPTLGEIMDSFPGDFLNIEIKDTFPGIEMRLADLIYEKGAQNRVVVGSVHSQVLETFRLIAPEVLTSGAESELRSLVILGKMFLGFAARRPMDAVQVPERSGSIHVVTRRFVNMCHRLGLDIHVWTVNDAPSMERLLNLGVDGIITDRPDLAQRILENRGLRVFQFTPGDQQ